MRGMEGGADFFSPNFFPGKKEGEKVFSFRVRHTNMQAISRLESG